MCQIDMYGHIDNSGFWFCATFQHLSQPMFMAMTKGHTHSDNRKNYKIFWYLIGIQFNLVGMLECYQAIFVQAGKKKREIVSPFFYVLNLH